jgi:hypothetical protein
MDRQEIPFGFCRMPAHVGSVNACFLGTYEAEQSAASSLAYFSPIRCIGPTARYRGCRAPSSGQPAEPWNAPSPRTGFLRKRLNEGPPSRRHLRLFDNPEVVSGALSSELLDECGVAPGVEMFSQLLRSCMPKQPIMLASGVSDDSGTVRALPADTHRELLDHVKRLRDEATQLRKPRKSGRGLWADLNGDLSAERIDEARRETWKTFPLG